MDHRSRHQRRPARLAAAASLALLVGTSASCGVLVDASRPCRLQATC